MTKKKAAEASGGEGTETAPLRLFICHRTVGIRERAGAIRYIIFYFSFFFLYFSSYILPSLSKPSQPNRQTLFGGLGWVGKIKEEEREIRPLRSRFYDLLFY